MKNFWVIWVLFAYLSSTTELGQLLKVPVLIGHFIEHREDDEKMTFWDYLVHHYGGHEIDADWETDMKLPFMRHADNSTIPVFPPNNQISIPKKAKVALTTKQCLHYLDGFIPAGYLNTIWQPPKSC